RVSPRAVGSSPAARSALPAAGAEPARPASAARRVLRRCASAASMAAKTSAREVLVLVTARRTSSTNPESTLGAGQKTLRPMVPARRAAAYQAILAEGTP